MTQSTNPQWQAAAIRAAALAELRAMEGHTSVLYTNGVTMMIRKPGDIADIEPEWEIWTIIGPDSLPRVYQ